MKYKERYQERYRPQKKKKSPGFIVLLVVFTAYIEFPKKKKNVLIFLAKGNFENFNGLSTSLSIFKNLSAGMAKFVLSFVCFIFFFVGYFLK